MKKVMGVDLGVYRFACCLGKVDTDKKQLNKKLEFSVLGLEKRKYRNDKEKWESFVNNVLLDRFVDLLQGVDLVVIEKPFNVKGYGQILIEVLGSVKMLCIVKGLEYVEVPQTVLKKFATGRGNAEKSDMVKQAFKEFRIDRETEDEVDSFWLWLFGIGMLNGDLSIRRNRLEMIKKVCRREA